MAMRFEHEFTLPVPVEQAWPVLLDVERVAPCLPGAAVDKAEDDAFTGRMQIEVGPITVTYQGRAAFEKVDEETHSMTLKASGKEARGSGTAGATVVARLHPEGRSTRVTVDTSFKVTGRPAQFGRGVMAEAGGKLIDRFAANLSLLLGESPRVETAAETDAGMGGVGGWSVPAAPDPVSAERVDETPAVSGTSGPGPARPAGTEEGLGDTGPEAAPPGPAGTTARAEEGFGGAGSDIAGATASREEAQGPAGPGRHLSAVPTPPGLATTEEAESRQSHPAGTSRTSLSPDEEALNLLEVAGLPLLKRVAPPVGVLAALILAAWLLRRALRRR